jgi:hypothetical protein
VSGIRLVYVLASGSCATPTEAVPDVLDVLMRSPFARHRPASAPGRLVAPVKDPGAVTGRAQAARADGNLSKPMDVAELLRTVEEYCGRE